MRSWLALLACLAAKAAALPPRTVVAVSQRAVSQRTVVVSQRAASQLRASVVGFKQRSRTLVAQYDQYPPQSSHAQPDLPAGWAMAFDEANGAYYYYEMRTGHCQWEPPARPNAAPVLKTLPAGWTKEFDQASGTEYYCSALTGHCQYEPPLPSVPRGGCEASKRPGYVQQHSVYDPRSATETYDQWLAKQGY